MLLGRPHGRGPGAEQKMKRDALRELIKHEDPRNALIFCNRKRDVDIVHRSLNRHGLEAARLHGDMSQPMRMETLTKFKTGEMRYLVCSDVAARGLDIPEMSHVFNFDVPTHAEDYVHRIGRTGRAGRKGQAFTIAVAADAKYIDAIERITKSPIPRIKLDGATGGDLDTLEEKPKRERNRRKGSEYIAPTEIEAEAPAKNDKIPDAATEKQGGIRERSRSRQRKEARKDELPEADDAPVKGLGDHVPAFMLREFELS